MKKEVALMITLLTVFTLIAFCPTASSKQGTLTGQVVDGFDNAVKDVEIEIEGTNFVTKTDENGQYSIGFNPGKIEMSFLKEGYARQRYPMMMIEASEVSMPKLTLWQYPDSSGIFLVRMQDYKNIEYGSFYSESDDDSISFYVKGNPTKIECGEDAFAQGSVELMLVDFSGQEPVVVGKNLYRINDKNLIGNIVFKSGNWGIEKVDDEYAKVSDRVGLRYVRLEPGRYFYCIGQITLRSKIGFGYYFEIVAPGLSSEE